MIFVITFVVAIYFFCLLRKVPGWGILTGCLFMLFSFTISMAAHEMYLAANIEDVTKEYSLTEICDGNYYKETEENIIVHLVDGELTKNTYLPGNVVSFKKGEEAALQITFRESKEVPSWFEIIFPYSSKKTKKFSEISSAVITLPAS